MALSFGKRTVIKTVAQATKVHKSVAEGKRLDPAKLNYSLKKSVSELLGQSKS